MFRVAQEESLTPTQVLGYLLHRFNHLKDKKMANLGLEILKGSFDGGSQKVEPETAVALAEGLEIGRRKYRNLASLLNGHIKLPPHQELSTFRRSILPSLSFEHHGIWSSIQEAMSSTVSRVLPLTSIDVDAPLHIVAKIKLGYDGSGSHAQYHQSEHADVDTGHFITGMFTLINLRNQIDGKIIWGDRKSDCSSAARPFVILPGKETRERVSIIQSFVNRGLQDITTAGFELKTKNDVVLNISVETELSMIDGKMVAVLSGLGGAYCTMCTASEEDCHSEEVVESGFLINRVMADVIDLSDDLVDDQGSVISVPGDYETRQGLTRKPLTVVDLNVIPVLHAKIRLLEWFLQLLYRIVGKVQKWGVGIKIGEAGKKRLEQAKTRVQKILEEKIGIRVDQPDPYGRGGSTNTGNLAVRFFSESARDAVVSVLPPDLRDRYTETLKGTHQRLSIILRVLSSKRAIETDAFGQFCLDTYLFIIRSIPWARISPSLHRVLAHSAEKIALNGGVGIGELSEEPLESSNKLVRRYRERLARKTNLRDNLIDVFSRLWARSDPVIRSREMQHECTKCQGIGNSSMGCPLRVLGAMGEDETQVLKFLEP